MGNEFVAVSAELINDKVQFQGKARTNQPIICDYAPPLGDGLGYTGLELFLVSLADCSGSTVVSLLRKMRKDVSGFRVNAQGVRREEHPTYFEKITLEFILDSRDAAEADLQKAIRLSEEKFCPVWAMIKNNVEVATRFKIVAS